MLNSEDFGTVMAGVVIAGILIVLFILLVDFAVRDARRRGKSAWLVSIACVFFFPWGLLAWLLFRPDPIDRGGRFILGDHRVQ